jgi:phosphohistidine phosphatase SixA
MNNRVLLGLLLGLLVALPAAALPGPDGQDKAARDAPPGTLQKLQQGGYVFYFRHGHTPDISDAKTRVIGDCTTQRNLDERGRAQAAQIGSAFASLKIPVGIVEASPYCRTMDTARLAFGRVQPTWDLFSLGQPKNPDDISRHAIIKTKLSTPPPADTNTVLVSHNTPIDTLAQEFLFEGEALIVRPLGPDQGFEVILKVAPEDWVNIR